LTPLQASPSHLIITFAVIAVCVFWMLGAYNRLVRLRNDIASAWVQVEVQLQRRAEALATLLRALAEPLASELAAVESVSEYQAQAAQAAEAVKSGPAQAQPVLDLVSALGRLEPALTRLLALMEHQPQLREWPEVEQPRNELLDVAARMPYAKQVFNEAVLNYNQAVQQWPTRLLSGLYSFGPSEPL
jgi:LemA protein